MIDLATWKLPFQRQTRRFAPLCAKNFSLPFYNGTGHMNMFHRHYSDFLVTNVSHFKTVNTFSSSPQPSAGPALIPDNYTLQPAILNNFNIVCVHNCR